MVQIALGHFTLENGVDGRLVCTAPTDRSLSAEREAVVGCSFAACSAIIILSCERASRVEGSPAHSVPEGSVSDMIVKMAEHRVNGAALCRCGNASGSSATSRAGKQTGVAAGAT